MKKITNFKFCPKIPILRSDQDQDCCGLRPSQEDSCRVCGGKLEDCRYGEFGEISPMPINQVLYILYVIFQSWVCRSIDSFIDLKKIILVFLKCASLAFQLNSSSCFPNHNPLYKMSNTPDYFFIHDTCRVERKLQV